MLRASAARFGPKTALVAGGRAFSFAELHALSDRVATALRARGIEAGDRVSLLAQNRWEWIVAYHGVLKAGAVVNPLNVMLTDDEVAYIANDCGAVAIFCETSRAAAIAALAAAVPSLAHVIDFDGETAGCTAFAALLDGAEEPAPAFEPEWLGLSTIGYTSGTTGRPKGAMQSHRAVLLNCALTATMHGRNDRDVVVTALPAPHVYGNVAINGTFLAGGTVVLMERFNAAEALSLIDEHRATLIEGVPTMYAMMLAAPEIERADLSSLERSTVGGQTISTGVIAEWERRTHGAPLLELWGMTELAGLGTTHAIYAPNVHGSIGVALPGIEVGVRSFEDRTKFAATGEAGELCVRGPLNTLGYYGRPDWTRDALDDDGWLHTGDVAYANADGYLFVVDRLKDMLITGGYNVYPAEIERVVAAHPAVAMVAVGRVADELKGEVARAYIVLRPSANVTEAEIVEHCRPHLAAYKLPRSVRFVPDLPKTSTGKIMRRELGTLDRALEITTPV
ncbi:MAG: AMP-binding protein [Candidatus Eremiobacteraeota bacterium]|nr:AMP-binding protein [Candidatus Eremiobacteraeota bacterium]